MRFFMLEKLSRQTYRKIVGNPDYRKAVAFAIFVKTRRPSSVIKDWSYRKLSQLTSLSPNTCKKRVAILESIGLVTREERGGHTYLRFARLRTAPVLITKKNKATKVWRPKRADIYIGGFSGESIKDIEMGLSALVIVEDASRKDYVRQLTVLASSPSKFTKSRKIKKAMEICRKRGNGVNFQDYGLSYRRICGWLKCGTAKVKNTIAFGESTGMFMANKAPLVFLRFAQDAKFAIEYIRDDYSFPVFATTNNVYYRPANTFTLGEGYRQKI